MLTFREFSVTNHRRCTSPRGFDHSLESWSLSDWLVAVVGELGEAANILKKLNRVRDGIPGNGEGEDEMSLNIKFRDEIADAFIYLDLLSQAAGFPLDTVIIDKFNRTSAKIGSDIMLPRS